MRLSLSVVLPSGWKVSYLPFGRRGGIPFAIASPERLHGASQSNLENMKPANVVEVKNAIEVPVEIVGKEKNDGNKAR